MARRGAFVSVLAVLSLTAAACGDPTTAPGAGSEGTTAPAATEAVSTSAPPPIEAPATIAPADTLSTEVDGTTAATPAPAAGDPTTTVPLGGVTVDDPMPPQLDAATDPVAAEAGVRFAYQHWILVDLDPTLRARLVENGEATSEGLERGIADARGIIEFGRLMVDEVRFTGVESADVVFRVEWQGGPSPYFPDPMTGTAVFRDGSWRISTHSLCLLAFGVGQDCAGASGDLPVSPEGYAVTALPADLQWVGVPGTPDLVAVPGTSVWAADPTAFTEPSDLQRTLSLTTDVLVGSSGLTDADADTVLSSGRFGLRDGTPIEVAGGRARALVQGDHVQVVVLRDDDVLLSAYAQLLSLDEVLAVLDSFTPTTLPDGFATQVELG